MPWIIAIGIAVVVLAAWVAVEIYFARDCPAEDQPFGDWCDERQAWVEWEREMTETGGEG